MVEEPSVPKEESSPEEKPEPTPGFRLEDLGVLGTVLAAIGGGLGVLGFVAFFGAAILWIRMDEVGLPGSDAVAIVPKPVLASTGASFLVPALVIAIGFTLLLYLADAVAVLSSERRVRRAQKWLREERLEVEELRREARGYAAVADEASARLSQVAGAAAPELKSQIVEAQAEDELRAAVQDATDASAKATEAQSNVVEFETELELTAAERERKTEWIRTGILVGATVLLFSALALAVFAQYAVHRSPGRWATLIGVTTGLVTVCVVVRLRTGSFGWFAVAAFVAVGLMIGTQTFYRTVEDPKMEPAAVLRSHGPPVFGFYVAQTSDRVYLATTPRKGLVRLDSVPREEILELLVGKLQRPKAAEARALAFAHRLCLSARQRKVTGRVTGKDGGGKRGEEISDGCTGGDLNRLEKRLAIGSQAAAASAPAASRSESARSAFSQVKSSSSRPK